MQPLERFVTRCGIGGVLVLAALLGIDAHAMAARADAVPQMVADTELASDRMPALSDCVPCVYCYAGPASTAHGFSGESKEQDASTWTALAKPAPMRQQLDESEWRRRSRMPVRIEYCRWRN